MTTVTEESANLRAQIRELQDTLQAIRGGGIDAVIAGDPGHERVYTLTGADQPYRVILEEMSEGAAVISTHSIVTYANRRLLKMLGRDSATLLGHDVREFIAGPDRDQLAADLLALEPGESLRTELDLVTADGTSPALLAGTAIDLEGTKVMSIVVTDLSDVRAAEERMRASEQLLNRVLDALPVGVYIVDREGRSQFGNTAALRLTGVDSPPASVGETIRTVDWIQERTGRQYAVEQMPLVRALAGEANHCDDIAIRKPSGESVALEVWGTPVRGPDGALDFAIVTFADVSERKELERAAAQRAALLEMSYDAVLIWEPDGRIVYWNRGAESTYGYDRDQALGSLVHELLQTELPRPMAEIQDLLDRDGQWEGELIQRRADGSRVIVDSRWAQLPDGMTGRGATMESNRDITARKAAERALAARAAELERSNQDLEQFAYVASHDLAEPLRAIWLPLSMIKRRYEGKLGLDADEYIEFAVDGCLRMQKMIDDLLRWSRVGRMEEEMLPLDCNGVVEDVLADLAQAVTDSHATVVVDSPLPTVVAEPGQLNQVFQNLISNSLKFVTPGVTPHVIIAAERQGEFWRFTVTDNGIGVDPRHRERIFGMFKRLHPRDEYPGTGIGLALTKKAIERHGGRVGVDDPPSGTGAQFWFTLPA